jgi:mercuric reductase
MKTEFDLVIMGWGAAAFSAAIKASELTSGGMAIAMIGTGRLGGTCVNVGCVPSKYLLESSHRVFYPMHPSMPGISPAKVEYSFADVMSGLRDYVNTARTEKYEKVIAQYRNITLFEGKARFADRRNIEIVGNSGDVIQSIHGNNILIATGSSPADPPIPGLDRTDHLNSENIWNISRMPANIIIAGGGAIGLEIGQALRHFGTEVTVVDSLPEILPQTEPEIAKKLREHLEDEGMKFILRARISRVFQDDTGKFMEVVTHRGNEILKADSILVATGRSPNTKFLDLSKIGIETEHNGSIITDGKMMTSIPGIYAAGDVVSKKLMLETLAAKEGVTAVSNILGMEVSIDYETIPWGIFTEPQIAGIGMTEAQFSARNGSCMSRTIQLSSVTKATITGETDGLIKIIAEPDSGRVVGVHVMSPNATDFISEAAFIMKNHLTIEDIVNTTHIFPSFGEGIKITAQSFFRDISKMSCCVE